MPPHETGFILKFFSTKALTTSATAVLSEILPSAARATSERRKYASRFGIRSSTTADVSWSGKGTDREWLVCCLTTHSFPFAFGCARMRIRM